MKMLIAKMRQLQEGNRINSQLARNLAGAKPVRLNDKDPESAVDRLQDRIIMRRLRDAINDRDESIMIDLQDDYDAAEAVELGVKAGALLSTALDVVNKYKDDQMLKDVVRIVFMNDDGQLEDGHLIATYKTNSAAEIAERRQMRIEAVDPWTGEGELTVADLEELKARLFGVVDTMFVDPANYGELGSAMHIESIDPWTGEGELDTKEIKALKKRLDKTIDMIGLGESVAMLKLADKVGKALIKKGPDAIRLIRKLGIDATDLSDKELNDVVKGLTNEGMALRIGRLIAPRLANEGLRGVVRLNNVTGITIDKECLDCIQRLRGELGNQTEAIDPVTGEGQADDAEVQELLARLGKDVDAPLRNDQSVEDKLDAIIKSLKLKMVEIELDDDQEIEDVVYGPAGRMDESLAKIVKAVKAMDKDEVDNYIRNPEEISTHAGAGAAELYKDVRTANGTYEFDGLSELETIRVIKLIKALEVKLKTPILSKIDTTEIEKRGQFKHEDDLAAERQTKALMAKIKKHDADIQNVSSAKKRLRKAKALARAKGIK